MSRRVRVELGPRSYDVLVGAGLTADVGSLARERLAPGASRAFVVVDSNLPKATTDAAVRSLAQAGLAPTLADVTASETHKSLTMLERLLTLITAAKLSRLDPVVALGGGVVGDLAGFAAAVYRRGVPVLQCPTTLLSMVDASVGGKTGVNIAPDGSPGSLKKNMIGAFWQPTLVLADVATLASLPPRERISGLAECIKHALLGGAFGEPALLEWILAQSPRLGNLESDTLAELVARNVAIKARVVAGDEREEAADDAGGRALLNLGHTFGHAIETLPNLSPNATTPPPLKHGEAVALGIVAACRTAQALNLLGTTDAQAAVDALSAVGLPTTVRNLPPNGPLIEAMSHDKKTLGGRLRLVLPTHQRRCVVVADPPLRAVEAGWDAIRA